MLIAAAAAAAAVHMDSTHPSSSTGSIISPPPWNPAAVPVTTLPTHHQQSPDHQQQTTVLFDRDLTPSTPTPAPPSPSPRNNHLLRPGHGAARRRPSSRRRPRPSRKVATTYITADPASFRRMVHQVTGADDLLLQLPTPPLLAWPAPRQHVATTLCRPAPTRATAAAGALRTLLPTLDTSALLLGNNSGSGYASMTTTTGPVASSSVRPAVEAAGVLEVDVGAGGAGIGGAGGYGGSDCGGGDRFPTLESWEALLYTS